MKNSLTYLLLLLALFSLEAQNGHSALLNLIPNNTATHVAIKSGSWFDPSNWNTNTLPSDGAIVYIPNNISIIYDEISQAKIFAIKVEGGLTITQKTVSTKTKLVVDTFIGMMSSNIVITALSPFKDMVEIVFTPFDIENHKASVNNWNTEAISHFSDGAPVKKINWVQTGATRYETYERSLEGGTKVTPFQDTDNISGVLQNGIVYDGSGVLGRYNWDSSQLSLGLITMGNVSINGAEKSNMSRLSGTENANASTITLEEAPKGWQVGDRIVVTLSGDDNIYWCPEAPRTVDYQCDRNDYVEIESIDGNTVHLKNPLRFEHKSRPQDDLFCYVGNLSRNILFRSEFNGFDIGEVTKRGHFMVMKMNDNTLIEIKNAAYRDMGRTNKSRPLDDFVWQKWVAPTAPKSLIGALGRENALLRKVGTDSISNSRGRYSIHLHKLGAKLGASLTEVTGNVVEGNPGWGITHHDSHANISDNVVFNVMGAGIVTESGSETGKWNHNLVVNVKEARSVSIIYDQDTFFGDNMFTGQGFGLKGRAVECNDNAIVNTRFGVFVENLSSTKNINMDRIDALQYAKERTTGNDMVINQFPLRSNGYSEEGDGIVSTEVPLIMNNTTVIKAYMGLRSQERDQNVNNESRSIFNGFKVWGAAQFGVAINYQVDYTFNDFFASKAIGLGGNRAAIELWKHSANHVFDGVKIVGFDHVLEPDHLTIAVNRPILASRNDGISPFVFIDLETENVTETYRYTREGSNRLNPDVKTDHQNNNVIFLESSDISDHIISFTPIESYKGGTSLSKWGYPNNFTQVHNHFELDYSGSTREKFRFTVDGIITDNIGAYRFGNEQYLAHDGIRPDFPFRIYGFSSQSKIEEFIANNGGIYKDDNDPRPYFIFKEYVPDRISNKYKEVLLKIYVKNAPNTGIFSTPKTPPASHSEDRMDRLLSYKSLVTQSSTKSDLTYTLDGNGADATVAIDCSPEKAIDQNTNGRINANYLENGIQANQAPTERVRYAGSFSQTELENEPWFDMDLGERKFIKYINIWNTLELNDRNKRETLSEHFKDFYVLISDNPFGRMTLDQARANANYEYFSGVEVKQKVLVDNVNKYGQYVRLQAKGTTIIKLAEIEVIGSLLDDGVAPIANCKDLTLRLDANGLAKLTTSDVNNDSSDDNTAADNLILELEGVTEFNCSHEGTTTEVTLKVIDEAGNSSSCVAKITIEDANSPNILKCIENQLVTLDKDEAYKLPDFTKQIVVSDNCSSILAIEQLPLPETILPSAEDPYKLIIKVSDNHGNTAECNFEIKVEQVVEESVMAEVLIYPNPIENTLFFENIENYDFTNIQIKDVTGRLVAEVDWKEVVEIKKMDVSDLSTGVYLLIINQNQEEQIIKKIVKK